MKKPLIYAVDDEEAIRELYSCTLATADFDAKTFANYKSFMDALNEETPDLILLDVMLEKVSGFDILKELKSNNKFNKIPVIMVSAKGDEISKVNGLNLGADDYIAKPFGLLELIARINANLRKIDFNSDKKQEYKDIVIDEKKREVTVKNEMIVLTLKEYELLLYFVKNHDIVLKKEQIFNDVWGEEIIESRTLDIHINLLRKKIINSETKITTIRGVGYLNK
jgi:two-component system alkaline phosphatase synthesis response regulator PhoP